MVTTISFKLKLALVIIAVVAVFAVFVLSELMQQRPDEANSIVSDREGEVPLDVPPGDVQEAGSSQAGESTKCQGSARCFEGRVTRIVDGDTIRVDDISIRFAIVDTPEIGETGYDEAKKYVARICPIGSTAIVDEDDRQTQGSYGRVIAEVHCNGINLNKAVLEIGLAEILTEFCTSSEFSDRPWAQKFGCGASYQEQREAEFESEDYQIVVAEAESNPAGPDAGNEWIKLYNPSEMPVDVSGWIIKSTHGRVESHTVQEGTVIAPCQHITILFSSQFLDNEDESVMLFDKKGHLEFKTPSFTDKSNDFVTWKNNGISLC